MPNTSSSVPYLLSSSMQSIRSRRPSAVLGGSQGSGLLQQLGSGMVRLTSSHQPNNGRTYSSSTVRKCPSLNITFSWTDVRMTIVIHSSKQNTNLYYQPNGDQYDVKHLTMYFLISLMNSNFPLELIHSFTHTSFLKSLVT